VILFPDVRMEGITPNQLNGFAEVLLSAVGDDASDHRRKFKGAWNGMLTGKVILFSNDPIEFQDESGALPGRFIWTCPGFVEG
jgi:hypothetical protein